MKLDREELIALNHGIDLQISQLRLLLGARVPDHRVISKRMTYLRKLGSRLLTEIQTPSVPITPTMEELESSAILRALKVFKWNMTEAAKALGVGRAYLYRKVKQHDLVKHKTL